MILAFILSGINRRLRYRETVRQLSGLTDRELSGLGIARGDIAAVARHSRQGLRR